MEPEWATVVKHSSACSRKLGRPQLTRVQRSQQQTGPEVFPPMPRRGRRRRRRRAAAVAIGRAQDSNIPYADIMRAAKDKVSLKELGISNTRVQRDVGGGILVEIPGPEGAVKAERLVSALTPVLEGKAVVTRPVQQGELRLTGLDASIDVSEIKEAIASEDF
ncbi:uncharacterized protein LOC109861146 [Pseudomyrmex gracilis]|uniref:uncharacterized protein LOC109861146 n=1 Tax=Pseudomyrmex gracilis TaxID=219809 RepID=UPI000994C4DB|nr:uncharacterized protein LOC109861146 [Pseudomyrmex gracilis]